MKICGKLFDLESGQDWFDLFFIIKGHNFKVPGSIWLVIVLGWDIVKIKNFSKEAFLDYLNAQKQSHFYLRKPIESWLVIKLGRDILEINIFSKFGEDLRKTVWLRDRTRLTWLILHTERKTISKCLGGRGWLSNLAEISWKISPSASLIKIKWKLFDLKCGHYYLQEHCRMIHATKSYLI